MSLSEVFIATRLDAEYFDADAVAAESQVTAFPYKLMKQVSSYIERGIQPDYVVEAIEDEMDKQQLVPVLRTVNIRERGFSDTRQAYVSEQFYTKYRKGQTHTQDVLITSTGVGTLGRVTFNHETSPYFIDGHITAIRGLDTSVDPLFLTAFLQSKTGRQLIERRQRGSSGQVELYSGDVGTIPIPILPTEFQSQIANDHRRAHQLQNEAQSLYEQAESLLIHVLGLETVDTTQHLTYGSTSSAAFSAARLDAEFFHPTKMKILQRLTQMPGSPVNKHFSFHNHLLNPPKQDTGERVYNYDLTDALLYFLDMQSDLLPTYELGSTKKRFQSGDVVVSRLRSYLREIAFVAVSEKASCVGSSEFIVLRPQTGTVYAELLVVYLRSPYVQQILKWSQSGTNHPRFDEDILLALNIPDRVIGVQEEIRNCIQKGIAAYRQAKHLLELSKQKVEAIILNRC